VWPCPCAACGAVRVAWHGGMRMAMGRGASASASAWVGAAPAASRVRGRVVCRWGPGGAPGGPRWRGGTAGRYAILAVRLSPVGGETRLRVAHLPVPGSPR
jgi:hypothetical protein